MSNDNYILHGREYCKHDSIPKKCDVCELEKENLELKEALSCLVCIVGLTAFKYENQREVLQESIDNANKILKGG